MLTVHPASRRFCVLLAMVAAATAAACGGGSKMSVPTAPSSSAGMSEPPPGVILYPPINSCELAYTSPGTYTLHGDVGTANASPASCIALGASGITLDCAQHVVTGFIVVAPGAASLAIRNCVATGIAPVKDASNLDIEYNRLTTSLYFNAVRDSVVRANQIGARPGATAVVALSGGDHNRVVENTLDGGGSRGADDGIVIANEVNDTIRDNSITNVFDAGVEGIDAVTDTLIANNTITHTVTAGIGAYWCTAWQRVTIQGNRFSGVRAGIRIEYSKDGRCAGWGSAPDPNFTGNVIADNILDPTVPNTAPAITVKLDQAPSSVSGNLLRGNQFGAWSVDLHPLSGFQDGGGNACSSAGNFKC